jgi:hypothetical protein
MGISNPDYDFDFNCDGFEDPNNDHLFVGMCNILDGDCNDPPKQGFGAMAKCGATIDYHQCGPMGLNLCTFLSPNAPYPLDCN